MTAAENEPRSPVDPALAAEHEVRATLHRFGALLAAHDPAIIHEFAPEADTLMVGSEAGELARGPIEIAELFRSIMAQPITVVFEWKEARASVAGDQAWLFAAGDFVLRATDEERRGAYRLTGVLQRRGGRWLWQHFHGSEPAVK